MDAVGKSSKIHEGLGIPQVEGPFPICDEHRLLEGEDQVADAALSRAVTTEEHGQWSQTELLGVLSGLEVFYVDGFKHIASSSSYSRLLLPSQSGVNALCIRFPTTIKDSPRIGRHSSRPRNLDHQYPQRMYYGLRFLGY